MATPKLLNSLNTLCICDLPFVEISLLFREETGKKANGGENKQKKCVGCFLYLVQHDGLHTVTQHGGKLSGDHRLAATLRVKHKQTNTPSLRRARTTTVRSVQNAAVTLAPIRHMSLVMCDCIISAISCDWLTVLMNVWLLADGRGSLEPAGT